MACAGPRLPDDPGARTAAGRWSGMQRLVLAAILLITGAVIAFLVSMIFLSAGPEPRPAAPQQGLLIPVAGVRAGQLSDTFTDARGRGRPHDAIDIMAPRGTLVVAAAEGVVEKLYFSRGGGGISVYVRSPDRRFSYYYAHLDGYAPGLAGGRRVGRGDPLGRVGSSGNASPTAPHLHFAIHAMEAGDRWWQGRPINPYPLLVRRDSPR